MTNPAPQKPKGNPARTALICRRRGLRHARRLLRGGAALRPVLQGHRLRRHADGRHGQAPAISRPDDVGALRRQMSRRGWAGSSRRKAPRSRSRSARRRPCSYKMTNRSDPHGDLGAYALINNDRAGLKQGLWLTVILGVLFTITQGYEYSHAAFAFSGNIYGATFFMATGFHGAHVIIGTISWRYTSTSASRPLQAGPASRLRIRRLVQALRRRGLAVPVRVDLCLGRRRARGRRALSQRFTASSRFSSDERRPRGRLSMLGGCHGRS
ncbi:hypothetical protein BTHI11S_02006 [Bosea thiooxidans]